ncbi:MAG: hypothetical protein ICV84_23410 [Flavisolibacter sp.]|nr:hypothetical protein [Flavisolibacter sp.]
MKAVAVPLLILLLLTQTFSKLLIMAEYNLNRDYIAQNLCENKNKPMLHCNGKCQLTKKMAEDEKQNSSSQSGQTGKQKVVEVWLSNGQFASATDLFPDLIRNVFPDYSFPLSTPPSSSLFHPPAAA